MQRLILSGLVLGIALIGAAGFKVSYESGAKAEEVIGSPWIASLFADKSDNIVSLKIEEGDTFGILAEAAGVHSTEILAILEAAKDKYNLARIVEGREISFIFGEDQIFNKLVYQINVDEVLVMQHSPDALVGVGWSAERINTPYSVETEEVSGTIATSLYEAIVGSGGDERVALQLAETFAWQVDFLVDIREGDSFKMIYEKRFVNGNYIGPGNILAAQFINAGTTFRGIYFASGDKAAYYDENGNALQKIFLKSPLAYKYISSGFTYKRVNPVTGHVGAHRAIDYAAPHGTPVVSIGDGTVAFSGWKDNLYGNAVIIRHNGTYSTLYGHFYSVAVRIGQRVKQGDVVGYVGSTGQSTGSHLHFEMYKNGGHVNPFIIELPPGEPVAESARAEFEALWQTYKDFFN
ncbi:MAG: peptidoglycan DD-metalloendopeptidase family protein [Candidatus Colwellbacteria bacterium]|nr:peptidoglycan DD-metalloendopeptidase family protein [Candidatus Colwellbacteria bacterium]